MKTRITAGAYALQRAETGLAHIDKRYPGRDKDIDINTLDAGHSERCPLTQASGMRFGVAIDDGKLTMEQLDACGFVHNPRVSFFEQTLAFKELLLKRRGFIHKDEALSQRRSREPEPV